MKQPSNELIELTKYTCDLITEKKGWFTHVSISDVGTVLLAMEIINEASKGRSKGGKDIV